MSQSVTLSLTLDLAHDDGGPLSDAELQATARAACSAAIWLLRNGSFVPALHVEVREVTADVTIESGEARFAMAA